MTHRDVIENRVSLVRKQLRILQRYRRYSRRDLEGSVDLRGAVERYLYLAIQSSIDLAESIIAGKDFRKPATLAESFRILNEEGLLPQGLTEELARMTGFRNILSHGYEDVDYKIVHDILLNKLADIDRFLKIVSKAYLK